MEAVLQSTDITPEEEALLEFLPPGLRQGMLQVPGILDDLREMYTLFEGIPNDDSRRLDPQFQQREREVVDRYLDKLASHWPTSGSTESQQGS